MKSAGEATRRQCAGMNGEEARKPDEKGIGSGAASFSRQADG